MLTTEIVDYGNKKHINRFIEIPFRLYQNHPQWVPPIRGDVALMLNPQKHPYYEHSLTESYLAVRDGQDVGRLTVLYNRNYNEYHKRHTAQFYLFECTNDFEAASALFEHAYDWARRQGADLIIGPKGFGPLDGYGLLIEGYEHRQLMNMMNYNEPYYVDLVQKLGFEKEVDFVSAFIDTNTFKIPERLHRIADRARQRSDLEIKRFTSKKELRQWAVRIGKVYNATFVNNWEYTPLTDWEIKFVIDNIMLVADHRLIKIITHAGEPVGFLFAFPDVSAAMQKIQGRLFPFGIVHLLREMKRTQWVALNGAGILPQFHGRGGNALLYSEMEKTLSEFHFQYADLTQVAETAVEMRSDLENLGGRAYKNHRVFRKAL
jgi:GNAT superfamily N-acetyltransferase